VGISAVEGLERGPRVLVIGVLGEDPLQVLAR